MYDIMFFKAPLGKTDDFTVFPPSFRPVLLLYDSLCMWLQVDRTTQPTDRIGKDAWRAENHGRMGWDKTRCSCYHL